VTIPTTAFPSIPCPAINALTDRQIRLYDFIVDFRAKSGISPTLVEMAEAFGVSKVTVFEHVKGLVNKGWLVRDKYRSRSLRPAVESLPPSEALRSGVADAAARLMVLHDLMEKRDVPYYTAVKSIHADLMKLLVAGGAQ
jgi:SOS-response transcriptional repressor LexA